MIHKTKNYSKTLGLLPSPPKSWNPSDKEIKEYQGNLEAITPKVETFDEFQQCVRTCAHAAAGNGKASKAFRVRAGHLGFQDSRDLKELCKIRRLTSDKGLKIEASKQICILRNGQRQEHRNWLAAKVLDGKWFYNREILKEIEKHKPRKQASCVIDACGIEHGLQVYHSWPEVLFGFWQNMFSRAVCAGFCRRFDVHVSHVR